MVRRSGSVPRRGGPSRGKKGGGRPHGKKGGKQPQTWADHDLWRRFIVLSKQRELSHDGPAGEGWNASSLLDAFAESEPSLATSILDSKKRRQKESEIAETVAHARKRSEVIIGSREGNFRFRNLEDVERIESKVDDWHSFLKRIHEKDEEAKIGPNWNETYLETLPPNDKEKCVSLLDYWESQLKGRRPNVDWSLSNDGECTTWKDFSLGKISKEVSQNITSLRFYENEPPFVIMLLNAERIGPRDVLEWRDEAKRREGSNPFPAEWSESVEGWAERLPEVDISKALRDGRSNLTHIPFLTIDPPDARDFDDAVAVVKNQSEWRLWVAIADVANYVEKDSALDKLAYARATSVYLPHKVLPMLPRKLANDLCSLRANVPRLAMVLEFKVDLESGALLTCTPHEAVIEVSENITYDDALRRLDEGDEAITSLANLAEKLRDQRVSLDLSNAEQRPRLSKWEGLHEEVVIEVKHPTVATEMIEAFMVAANEAVGHLLGEAGAALPWRVHTPPDAEEVKQLNSQLAALGIEVELPRPSHRKMGVSAEEDEAADLAASLADWAGGNISFGEGFGHQGEEATGDDEEGNENYSHLSEVIDSDARHEMLTALQQGRQKASEIGGSVDRIMAQGMLRLMQRAIYSEVNLGHFGLGLDTYLHFTSPIRRYPDLVVHRQLKSWLRSKNVNSQLESYIPPKPGEMRTCCLLPRTIENIERTGDVAKCSNPLPMHEVIEWTHSTDEMIDIATHCTSQGRAAQLMEWELVAVANSLHLWQHPDVKNKPRKARVVGLHNNSIYLDLDDDGSLQTRLTLRQLSKRQKLIIDDDGVRVVVLDDEEMPERRLREFTKGTTRAESKVVLELGQLMGIRVTGLDCWRGRLDVSPAVGN